MGSDVVAMPFSKETLAKMCKYRQEGHALFNKAGAYFTASSKRNAGWVSAAQTGLRAFEALSGREVEEESAVDALIYNVAAQAFDNALALIAAATGGDLKALSEAVCDFTLSDDSYFEEGRKEVRLALVPNDSRPSV